MLNLLRRGDRLSSFSRQISQHIEKIRGATPSVAEADDILSDVTVHPDIKRETIRILEKGSTFEKIIDNAHILRRANSAERLAYFTVCSLAHWNSREARKRLKDALATAPCPYGALRIDRDASAHVAPPVDWSVLRGAVNEALEGFENNMSDLVNPGKDTMRAAQLGKPLFESDVWRYGTDPGVLRVVSDYLGVYPILLRINLLLSSNDRLQQNSSQFPHLDPEDFQQIKIFLYVNDVDEDTGPFQILRSDASDRVQLKHNYRYGRLTDEQLYKVAKPNDLIVCLGKAGTANFADTSRGFHFGSRPSPKPRKLIMYQYVTPFAASWAMESKTIKVKYSEAGAALAEAKGTPLSEADEFLLGIRR